MKNSFNKELSAKNFSTIVYRDSASEGWKQILDDLKIPVLISPLHDHDILPDGTYKKPHWHVLVMCESEKTKTEADEICAMIGGSESQMVDSARGYVRYFCHKDNSDKAQYSCDEIMELGGASLHQLYDECSKEDD